MKQFVMQSLIQYFFLIFIICVAFDYTFKRFHCNYLCIYSNNGANFFFLLDYFLKDCWHTMKTYTTWECPVINNFVKDWIWIAFWSFKHVFFFCWYKFCLIISINVSIEHIKLIAWASFKKKNKQEKYL